MLSWMILYGTSDASEYRLTVDEDPTELVANLQPGDTLIFQAGTYTISESWVWTITGTASDPINIRAEEGASFVLSAGASVGIHLLESDWVNLDGFKLHGDSDWESNSNTGIYLQDSEDINVSNVEIYNLNSDAVYIVGERVVVEKSRIYSIQNGSAFVLGCENADCWVRDCVIRRNWISNISAENGYGILMRHGSQGNDIQDNVFYDIRGTIIYAGSNLNGDRNVIDANVAWLSNSGISLRGAALVQNNILFNLESEGINSRSPDMGQFGELVIVHNTIVNTGGWGIFLENWLESDVHTLTNNAVCNPVGRSVYLMDEEEDTDELLVYQQHNISSNLLCGYTEGLFDFAEHYVVGRGFDEFISKEQWDFYPSENSLLIDAADNSGYLPAFDFNGVPRNAAAPDIGAFEWEEAANPGWSIQESYKSFDLNYLPETNYVGGCGSQDKAALLLLPLVGFFRRRGAGNVPTKRNC